MIQIVACFALTGMIQKFRLKYKVMNITIIIYALKLSQFLAIMFIQNLVTMVIQSTQNVFTVQKSKLNTWGNHIGSCQSTRSGYCQKFMTRNQQIDFQKFIINSLMKKVLTGQIQSSKFNSLMTSLNIFRSMMDKQLNYSSS